MFYFKFCLTNCENRSINNSDLSFQNWPFCMENRKCCKCITIAKSLETSGEEHRETHALPVISSQCEANQTSLLSPDGLPGSVKNFSSIRWNTFGALMAHYGELIKARAQRNSVQCRISFETLVGYRWRADVALMVLEDPLLWMLLVFYYFGQMGLIFNFIWDEETNACHLLGRKGSSVNIKCLKISKPASKIVRIWPTFLMWNV